MMAMIGLCLNFAMLVVVLGKLIDTFEKPVEVPVEVEDGE